MTLKGHAHKIHLPWNQDSIIWPLKESLINGNKNQTYSNVWTTFPTLTCRVLFSPSEYREMVPSSSSKPMKIVAGPGFLEGMMNETAESVIEHVERCRWVYLSWWWISGEEYCHTMPTQSTVLLLSPGELLLFRNNSKHISSDFGAKSCRHKLELCELRRKSHPQSSVSKYESTIIMLGLVVSIGGEPILPDKAPSSGRWGMMLISVRRAEEPILGNIGGSGFVIIPERVK